MTKKKSKAERELEELEEVFKALSHNVRRHILVVLNARGGQMTAGDIASRFSCAWPTTTRHLRQLIYFLDKKKLNSVVGDWLHWFNEQK